MKWVLPEARLVLVLFFRAIHLKKGARYTLKRARESEQMGFAMGSSEPFAPSASNIVYTQRNSRNACHTYSSAAHGGTSSNRGKDKQSTVL